MILKVFSLFDSKAAAYASPFFMLNEQSAVRELSDLVNEPTSKVHRHPEDYTLFELGEWDDGLGEFRTFNPRPVVNSASLVRVLPKGMDPSGIVRLNPESLSLKNGEVKVEEVQK